MQADLDPTTARHPLIEPLNHEQRVAVLTCDGPILVLAGAGSGKTRVITHRIAWLIEQMGVAPWQILAMTFTNKAAKEMRERVAHTAGERAHDLWLGTFHSIGVRLLRQLAGWAQLQPSFSIYDTDDQNRLLAKICKALNIADSHYKPKQFAGYIDRAKNKCLAANDPQLAQAASGQFEKKALQVYAAYEREMRLANAVDFGDLIMLPVQVLATQPDVCHNLANKFRYVLVDEFQDTNYAQFELLKYLTSVHGNLCVVGDDDQSIYSWRGAEVGNILSFPTTFGPDSTVVKLERNYRSTATILQASTAVVQANKNRHGKVLWTEAGAGELITLAVQSTDRDEADWVARTIEKLRAHTPLSQFAVFYRTNACSRVLEDAMRRFRLPYVLLGGMKFYERAEVKDCLSWCRLLINPDDSAAFLRAVTNPKRGVGDTTLELVAAHAETHGLSLPRAAEDLCKRGEAGRNRDKLSEFLRQIDKLRDGIDVLRTDLAGARVLEGSGLKKALADDDSPEAKDRLENLQQLLAAMGEHADSADEPTLRSFLENVALVSDSDRLNQGVERLSLMTMHTAKGLEFDVTFVVGLEEGLCPHANVIGGSNQEGGNPRELEEERRLLYVAMTRARKKMHLSYAKLRRRFDGREMPSEPSRFLQQVPRELVQVEATAGWRQAAAWGGGRPAGPQAAGGAWGNSTAIPAWRNSATPAPARPAAPGGAWASGGTWPAAKPAGPMAPQSHGDDLPVIDRSEGHEIGFRVGGRASHVRFGVGQVLDIAGYGSDAQLTVQFAQQVGVKKVVARFLRAV